MEQIYTGDTRGNPFAWLSEIECPVRIATAEKSWPIYKEMASRAAALIPARQPMEFSKASVIASRRKTQNSCYRR